MTFMQMFCEKMFKIYSPIDKVIDIYDVLLENLQDIIQGFQNQHFYKNEIEIRQDQLIYYQHAEVTQRNGKYYAIENIKIDYNLSNCRVIKPKESPDLPLTQTECTTQRKYDYACKYVFDIEYIITLFDKNLIQMYQVKMNKTTFDFTMPIPTNCCWDRTLFLTPRQRYDLGLDIYQVGGNTILAGVQTSIQNVPSKPFNKLIVVDAGDYKNQRVRCELISQVNPFFGNSYFTNYMIIQCKDHTFDIIAQMKQEHDIRFRPASKNGNNYISISLLFYAYGAQNDMEIINYCNPENNHSFSLFLIEIMRTGTHHLISNKYKTQESALAKIAELVLYEPYQKEIRQVLTKYINILDNKFLIQLGEIVRKMYKVFCNPKTSYDKDDLVNKSIEMAPHQIAQEFYSKMFQQFKKSICFLLKNMKVFSFAQIQTEPHLIQTFINSSAKQFSDGLNATIKKSFVSPTQSQNGKIRKALDEEKTKQLDYSTKMDIVIRPKGVNGKVAWGQRQVHKSHAGFIDAIQTPESGDRIGRELAPTLFLYSTIPVNPLPMKSYILNHKYFQNEFSKTSMKIKFNHKFLLGFVEWEHWHEFYVDLLDFRRQNSFYSDCELLHKLQQIERKTNNPQPFIKLPINKTQSEAEQRYNKIVNELFSKPLSELQFNYYRNRLTKKANQLFVSVSYDIKENEINILTVSGNFIIPIISRNWDGKESMFDMMKKGDMIWIDQHMIHNFHVAEYSTIEKKKLQRYETFSEKDFNNNSEYNSNNNSEKIFKQDSNNNFEQQSEHNSEKQFEYNSEFKSKKYILDYTSNRNHKPQQYSSFKIKFSCINQCPTWFHMPYGYLAIFPATNPLTNHNVLPRQSLSTSQMRQVFAQYATNVNFRCTNCIYNLHQLQKSPIETAIQKSLFKHSPSIQLCYMAFMQFTNNQEDAIIANKGFIARGGFGNSCYRTFMLQCKKSKEQFKQPSPQQLEEQCKLFMNEEFPDKYHLVQNEHAMAENIGETVNYGDVLISKFRPVDEKMMDDESYVYDFNYEKDFSQVSNVMYDYLENIKTKLVRIQLSRKPILGDKVASLNCQKSTIGSMPSECELPICLDTGIVPSLIMNSASILKRETFGQLIEPALNNYLLKEQLYVIETGYDQPITDIIEQLNTIPQQNMSGLSQQVLCGTMAYVAQCHLVAQKIRAREGGKIDMISRQPNAGKKNNGGLKSGVPDLNAQAASGAMNTIIQQVGQNSSNIQNYFCKKCQGTYVYYEIGKRNYICPKCGILQDGEYGAGSSNYSLKLIENLHWTLGQKLEINQIPDDTLQRAQVDDDLFNQNNEYLE